MRLTRAYINYSDEIIREDTITMERHFHVLVDGVDQPTFIRRLAKEAVAGAASQTIASIQCSGDWDAIETASGNYTYCTWTFGGGTVICDMSDLPVVGDNV